MGFFPNLFWVLGHLDVLQETITFLNVNPYLTLPQIFGIFPFQAVRVLILTGISVTSSIIRRLKPIFGSKRFHRRYWEHYWSHMVNILNHC